MDLAGNLYVADTDNHTIRKVNSAGESSTLAGLQEQPGSNDGVGSNARFNSPKAVAVDRNGNVYVADTGNHTIRKITSSGVVTTVAGQAGKKGSADGDVSSALFDSPDNLAVDASGNVYLYNTRERKISGGQVQTLQIPAQGLDADSKPVSITGVSGCPAIDATGQLYFWGATSGYQPSFWRLLKLDLAGQLTEIPGTIIDPSLGTYQNAVFNDAAGNIFVTEDYLRLVSGQEAFRGYRLQSLTGFQSSPDATFVDPIGRATTPRGIAVDQAGHWYYTRDTDDAIIRDTAVFTGIGKGAVDGPGSAARFDNAIYLTADVSGNVWVAENPKKYYPYKSSPSSTSASRLRKVSPEGAVTTEFTTNFSLYYSSGPAGLAVDGLGRVYLGEYDQYSFTIYQVAPPSPAISLGAGSSSPYFSELASDRNGNLWAYFRSDGKLYRRAPAGTWNPVAGAVFGFNSIKDGTGDQASFGQLWSPKTDTQGNCFALDLLRADDTSVQACFIRKITADGKVTTISKDLLVSSSRAGATTRSYPGSLVVDSHDRIFLTRDHGIVLLDTAGNETPVGGKIDEAGRADGIGDQARFTGPATLAVDGQDNLYVFDDYLSVVRKGEFLGYIPGIATQPQSQTVPAGSNVQFSVTASSTPAPAYQWYFNGNAIVGATTNTFSLASARNADAGDYTVVVTNSLGSVTSNKATLTISAAPAPTPTPTPSGGGSLEGWFAMGLVGMAVLHRLCRPR